MPRLGVNWGSSPDISGATQSLGAALAGAMNGGGGAAQSRAARDAAYIESLNHHNAVYDAQAEQYKQKVLLDQQAQQQKQALEAAQQGRAQGAADTAWQAEDARIKPAGVGVLAPGDPAIVQYDTNSKAIHDRLKYIYGNGDGNPEQRAGAANQATGGMMIQNGNQNDFLRGNALNGKTIGEKDLLPSVGVGREPVPVTLPGGPKAAAGAKPTAENLKAAGFVPRLEDSNRIMQEPKVAAASQNLTDRALDYVPVIGRFFQSEDFKRLSDAEKDMVTAVLRDESGATIGDSEFVRDADKYFPRYGDSPQVLADKANRRRIQIEAMKMKAGPALQEQGGGSGEVSGAVTTAPDVATLQAEAQAAIAAGADPQAVMARLKQLTGGK